MNQDEGCKYYQVNRKDIRKCYPVNREEWCEYYQANREKRRKYQSEYYQVNRDENCEYHSESRRQISLTHKYPRREGIFAL